MTELRALSLTTAALIGLTLLPRWAAAFSLTPLSVSLDSKGSGATRSLQVHNDSDQTIAVELSMATREMNEDGTEKQNRGPEIEKNFLLFPPQLTLKANERKTVRLSWIGTADPSAELAYRVIAEQLPVQTEKQKAKNGAVINILLKYVGAVYVTPEKAAPQIVLGEAKAVTTEKKESKLSLLFENKGTAHQVLTGLHLKITPPGGETITLTPKELQGVDGQNVLAGKTRRFMIPWPSSVPKGPIKVEFELQG